MEAEIPYDVAGAPWIDQPVMLNGPREPMYNLTEAQYAFVSQYWLFWYEADHRYALPTVAFFVAVIAAFALAAGVLRYSPSRLRRSRAFRTVLAGCRYLSYKSWRATALHWYSPAAGIWLVGILGAVFFLSMALGARPYYWPNTETVHYGDSPPIATRSGWMSIACLPFVLVLAAKESPVSLLTGIPHDQLMVFHRWTSWAMFVLALTHTFPFIVYHTAQGDTQDQWRTSVFWWTGVVALLAQSWLQLMSLGFIRNKFYETFRALHYIMAALFFVFLFFHCDFTLTSWNYLIAGAVLYAVCFATSQLRTWAEHGIGAATIEALPSGTVCIRILTQSRWYPGQHIFLRFLTWDLHGLTSHPFTICSLPLNTRSSRRQEMNEMVMFIQPRGGMTRRLATLAHQRPGRRMRVMLDGPYGGMKYQSLDTFGQALMISGGAGAGFTLPIVEEFLQQPASEPPSHVATGTLKVITAVKTYKEYEWYATVVSELINSYPKRAAFVSVEIFITNAGVREETTGNGEKDVGQLDGINCTELVDLIVHRGYRPDLPVIIEEIVADKRYGSVGVAVCGPSSMLFDVRQAVASAQAACIRDEKTEVYLYSEHFDW